MELLERAEQLTAIQSAFTTVAGGEGHAVFISGEAGIGKTALVKNFCHTLKKQYTVLQGSCDALFTPRPLAPVLDILVQLTGTVTTPGTGNDRSNIFHTIYHLISQQPATVVIVFEDVHWADEASLDFIKFFARRIQQLDCLFILTYRDNEVHSLHPLRNVLGHLSPGSFTRIALPLLSQQAVDAMATEKGFNGTDVFSISGGNPFYVTEILASYSSGIPDNIKDAVLSVYARQDENAKQLWELLSVMPEGLETDHLARFYQQYAGAIERGLQSKILLATDGSIRFKHELYRRTIESNLSPVKRIHLHNEILSRLTGAFEKNGQAERIIHHAKNANAHAVVVQYAPSAAKKAVQLGAHVEASRLYLTAIEYYKGTDKKLLIDLYEAYAYESYLINQVKEAIAYAGKALTLWKETGNAEQMGNCLRFLSRLWWYDGSRQKAETYAKEAIGVLEQQPASAIKAMALSNMAQLSMLAKQAKDCIFWGEQAIAMAKELNNKEILSHALNNTGSIYMRETESFSKGVAQLEESLALALEIGHHEHAARAYTNLTSTYTELREYKKAMQLLDEGIRYCEERDLDSWNGYMSSWKARLLLETGHWKEALSLAEQLRNGQHASVIIMALLPVMARLKIRMGLPGARELLQEARTKALEAMELQRIVPAFCACLEYEWLTGESLLEEAACNAGTVLLAQTGSLQDKSEWAFWLYKARNTTPADKQHTGYCFKARSRLTAAVDYWKTIGCPYEEALLLFEGSAENKKAALSIVQQLGATTVAERMKGQMRSAGIKSIPRGIRASTSANPARLTQREMDILPLLKEGLQNKEIAARLFISAKTVDHHISSILFKLDVNARAKAVQEAMRLKIIQ
ncbi:MAG TPA: AAA family ATPase [Chitinophagaceae bacterium]|nr:AAA family ATPase [Chitinophagaceae bacterium]